MVHRYTILEQSFQSLSRYLSRFAQDSISVIKTLTKTSSMFPQTKKMENNKVYLPINRLQKIF
jgi:hypothetical protein